MFGNLNQGRSCILTLERESAEGGAHRKDDAMDEEVGAISASDDDVCLESVERRGCLACCSS